MHWTSPHVELALEANGKTCTRCQKLKSLDEFFKQGTRHESLCKECKKEARSSRKNSLDAPKPDESTNTISETEPKQKPKSYEDLGFTKEEFLELVDFFQELMRLDQKGN